MSNTLKTSNEHPLPLLAPSSSLSGGRSNVFPRTCSCPLDAAVYTNISLSLPSLSFIVFFTKQASE